MRRVEIRGVVIEDLSDEEVRELRQQLGGASRMDDSAGLLTTAEAAARLGMSCEYMRDHAEEYGGRKIGNVWRFDPAALAAVSHQKPEIVSPGLLAPGQRHRERKRAPILEVRGERP
jgi:hypothetical protein